MGADGEPVGERATPPEGGDCLNVRYLYGFPSWPWCVFLVSTAFMPAHEAPLGNASPRGLRALLPTGCTGHGEGPRSVVEPVLTRIAVQGTSHFPRPSTMALAFGRLSA
jgi:hypothetical protein